MSGRVLVIDDSPTIRKIVCETLDRRGYVTVPAADGEEAMAALGEAGVELALVDFVMPKMNGFQFCRALRNDPKHAQTPVVLMSAKSERIREKFVEQTGAVDALTKPFDARALVAVVENVMQKTHESRGESATPLATAPLASEDFVEADATLPPFDEGDETTRRVRLAGVLVMQLAARLKGFGGLSEDELMNELATRIPSGVARQVVAGVRDSEGVVLSGTLPLVPLSTVLHMLGTEQLSGQLLLWREGMEITASFRDGLVDLVEAKGTSEEFRLGRYLVETGLISRDDLEPWLIQSQGANRRHVPLGDRLREAGLITEQQLQNGLRGQSTELIYEVLRWKRGYFEFRRERPTANATRAKLSLSVATLVVEGFRRVDEWRHIETVLGSFDGVLNRDADASQMITVSELPAADRKVYALIDGVRSMREVIAASGLRSFEASRILAQFLSAQIVRRRVGT
jgi:DNA-binding response OmpR family regulator